ncbi:DNA cytosine methyltransferase [Rhizobium leguminosarum bv. viciae]|nr:DNA cytosine methyltransferase [Rhizobium leguminosarum bv. viciae]
MASKNSRQHKGPALAEERTQDSLSDVDTLLRDTRIRILQNRRQLVKTLADLAKNVGKMLALPARAKMGSVPSQEVGGSPVYGQNITDEHVNALLLEMGLSARDLRLLQGFSNKLGDHQKLLIGKAVHFDTIDAMISSNKRTRKEALVRIAAGASLSAEDIKQIKKEFHRVSDGGAGEQYQAYDQRLKRAANTMAKHNVDNFRSAISAFLTNFAEYQEVAKLLPTQLEDWEKLSAAFNIDPDQFDTMRAKLAQEADAAFVKFDELFPGVCIPRESWGEHPIDSAELLLAKAHFLLSRAATGDFSHLTSEYSSFLDLNGLDTLQSLVRRPDFGARKDSTAGMAFPKGSSFQPTKRRPAIIDDLSPHNPIRRFTAVEIYSASGAGALGLESAAYRVAAVCEENPRARKTISRNRPDWGVASEMTLSAISHATPAHLKGKQIDVVCGALPGRPWERKQGGAADDKNALPNVLSLLREVRPDGLFFEISSDFLDPRHVLHHNKLIQDLRALGYLSEIYQVSGEEYGLAQKRHRAVIMGVKRSLNRALMPPLIDEPVRRSLDSVLEGNLRARAASASAKATYNDWDELHQQDSHKGKLSPDLYTLTDPNSPVLKAWREIGFECDYMLSPQKRRRRDETGQTTSRMTISALKALQGIPAKWEVTGTEPERCDQVCKTIPPKMMRLLAQAMHATLTGYPVDLTQSLGLPIRTIYRTDPWFKSPSRPVSGFKKQLPYGIRPVHLHDDVQCEIARRYRIEQEIENGPFDNSRGANLSEPVTEREFMQFEHRPMAERIKNAKMSAAAGHEKRQADRIARETERDERALRSPYPR